MIAEAIKYLASAVALGFMGTIALQVVRKIWPSVNDYAAVVASVLFAALTNVVANMLIPWLPKIPPGLDVYWTTIVWAAQQLWYLFFTAKKDVRGIPMNRFYRNITDRPTY